MSLRYKLLILSILLALAPLFIAGRSLIKISRDEMKSTANDNLLRVGGDIARQIDDLYLYTWVAPMRLIQKGIESPGLGTKEKLALLREGLRIISDLGTMQISVEGIAEPLVVMKDDLQDKVAKAGYDPSEQLVTRHESRTFTMNSGESRVIGLQYLEQADLWLMSIAIPMDPNVFGRRAVLSAMVDMTRLMAHIEGLSFNKAGFIAVMDESGNRVLSKDRSNLTNRKTAETAVKILASETRSISVEPYTNPEGENVLGCYAFPTSVDWAVIVEQDEAKAYAAVHQMERSLAFWIGLGLLIAIIGAVTIALSLTHPLEKLTVAARRLAGGDLKTKVEAANRRDEIGTLAETFNKMVGDLNHYIDELTETTKLKERAEGELRLAWNIQKSFLPGSFPKLKGFDIFGTCSPAREVGGDYYDLFPIDEKHYAIVIGDVTGKGVSAALFMAVCRTLFRILCSDGRSPDKVLKEFNDRLVSLDSGANMFITIFYALLDIETGKLTYSSAGHNMPVYCRGTGFNARAALLDPMNSLVAGIMDGMDYPVKELQLSKNESLILYTDGMIEPINTKEEEFGDDRFVENIISNSSLNAEGLSNHLVKVLTDYQVGMPIFDDMTLLVVKRTG